VVQAGGVVPDPQRIQQWWEDRWGTLTAEHRIRFLRHPALNRLVQFKEPWVREAIRLNQRLADAVRWLEDWSQAGETVVDLSPASSRGEALLPQRRLPAGRSRSPETTRTRPEPPAASQSPHPPSRSRARGRPSRPNGSTKSSPSETPSGTPSLRGGSRSAGATAGALPQPEQAASQRQARKGSAAPGERRRNKEGVRQQAARQEAFRRAEARRNARHRQRLEEAAKRERQRQLAAEEQERKRRVLARDKHLQRQARHSEGTHVVTATPTVPAPLDPWDSWIVCQACGHPIGDNARCGCS
jgi:hypothetical protein